MKKRQTAGELAHKALADTTNYNALEIGYAMVEDVGTELRKAIDAYKNIIDEEEFCVVYVIADDPLIKPLKRHKYYCWPYLPSPRPNQSVFLYNKTLDDITKRLWVLPNALTMAKLAQDMIVPKTHKTMQAWSIAFFKGTFWEYIRYESGVNMLSEHEYLLAHRQELINAGCKIPDHTFSEPFDFSKVAIEKIIDTKPALLLENSNY